MEIKERTDIWRKQEAKVCFEVLTVQLSRNFENVTTRRNTWHFNKTIERQKKYVFFNTIHRELIIVWKSQIGKSLRMLQARHGSINLYSQRNLRSPWATLQTIFSKKKGRK